MVNKKCKKNSKFIQNSNKKNEEDASGGKYATTLSSEKNNKRMSNTAANSTINGHSKDVGQFCTGLATKTKINTNETYQKKKPSLRSAVTLN